MQKDKQILWHIKNSNLFAGLDPAALEPLAESVEAHNLRRRQIVYLPGDPGNSVFAICSGRVKISKVTRDGKALTLSYCGASEIFGETCLVEGGAREEMAETMENTIAIEIGRADLEMLVAKHPHLGLRMIKLLASRCRTLENKLESLVFQDITAKLAKLLLRLASEYGVQDTRGILLALKITHQELANLIGSTRGTVSLTLSHFKRKKLITTEGRKFIVVDSENLRALC